MSFKAKDLSYESNTPAFLRRLRGEVAGHEVTGQQLRPGARPKRINNDEDDGPTYVFDETNETLSKADYEALVAGKAKDEQVDSDNERTPETTRPSDAGSHSAQEQPASEDTKHAQQNVTEAGLGQRKRKIGKIVASTDEDAQEPTPSERKSLTSKPKKKAKAIKLAFGDEEGD